MPVRIELRGEFANVLVTEIPLPSTTGDNETSKRIVACRDTIAQLFQARKTAKPKETELDKIRDSVDSLLSKVIESLNPKMDDALGALGAIEDSIMQLQAIVELLGSSQVTEKAIRDDAEAKKAAIDAEVERKLSAVAVIEKS